MNDQLSKVVRAIALEMKAHRAMGSRIEELDSWSRQLNEAIESAAALPAVPDGWELVPKEIMDRFPEINASNYDHDDVCALNAWGVELVLAAIPAHDQPEGSGND